MKPTRPLQLLLLVAVSSASAKRLASLETGAVAGPPPLISPEGRERLLREAASSFKRDNPQLEWYTRKGERLLKYLLAMHLRQAEADGTSPARGKRHIDLDGLWLLCRACMGGIEAALIELGRANTRVERVRYEWRKVKAGSPSLTANYAVAAVTRRALRLGRGKPLLSSGSANGDDDEESRGGGGGGCGLPLDRDQPLGSERTRLGLGIRRRALLRSEAALATHAGALHDLRVLLRDVGGEWLELGRWVGGPPLASMPWDAAPCADQQGKVRLELTNDPWYLVPRASPRAGVAGGLVGRVA